MSANASEKIPLISAEGQSDEAQQQEQLCSSHNKTASHACLSCCEVLCGECVSNGRHKVHLLKSYAEAKSDWQAQRSELACRLHNLERRLTNEHANASEVRLAHCMSATSGQLRQLTELLAVAEDRMQQTSQEALLAAVQDTEARRSQLLGKLQAALDSLAGNSISELLCVQPRLANVREAVRLLRDDAEAFRPTEPAYSSEQILLADLLNLRRKLTDFLQAPCAFAQQSAAPAPSTT